MSICKQKRGKRWTVSVRLNGHYVSATFDLAGQADEWTKEVRREILSAHAEGRTFDPAPFKIKRRKLRSGDSILPVEPTGPTQDEIDADPVPRADWTLRQALRHYDDTEVEKLSGARQARARIKMWRAQPLALKRLGQVSPDDLVAWVAGRTKAKRTKLPDKTIRIDQVPTAASTVRNDAYRVGALYELAMKPVTKGGWGISGLTNPVASIALPALPPGRQRRLDHGDEECRGEGERLLEALASGPDPEVMLAFWAVAIGTGMRRSEVLDLRAGEVRSTPGGRVIERDTSKNKHPRRIVLMTRAAEAVAILRKGKQKDEKLFGLKADQITYRWRRARKIAGCPNLRLHDLRHEALSIMADAGLSIGALSQQSGHRTTQTLLRYVQARESEIRERLQGKMD